jgi:hypothetical protein
MYTSGSDAQVANRLSALIGLPDVTVEEGNLVMPRGFLHPAEARLGENVGFLNGDRQHQVMAWWLQVPGNTPNWDIAARATI